MSSTQNGRDENGELHTFEKNRYFHGKLMTARDMLTEQDYHAERLAATNRYVNGQGIVCGLDVDESEGGLREEEGELRVALRPGFALDGSGRPVVATGGTVTVKHPETNLPGVPEGDIDLYVRFDECDVETVPLPGSENACKEECTYNRILEVFDVVFESVDERDATVGGGDDGEDAPTVPNGYKPVRTVAFPGPDDVTEGEDGTISLDDPGLMTIAREYYETHLSECRGGSESWVFLGTFTDPTDDGTWERVAEDARFPHGSLVYTNDMLYAAVARHTADFHNPHAVTLDVTDEAGDASVRVVDDDSPGGAVGIGSDATIDISGTARSGDTPSSVSFGVNVEEVSDRIDAVRNIQGATPNAEGRIDLVPSGAVSITQEPGSNGLTFDVPEVSAVEQIGNATPNDAGRVNINGTQGVVVTTSGNQITIRGPGTPEVPDLEVLIRATARRSITCKFVSYSAAGERFSNVDDRVSELMGRIASIARDFVEEGAFEAEAYLEFIERVFEMEDELNDVLRELAGEVYTEPSVERYVVAFEQLARVLEELEREAEGVPEIAAAQDCLTRAAEALLPVERRIG